MLLVAGAGAVILVAPLLRAALTAPGTAVRHSANSQTAGPPGASAAPPTAPAPFTRAQRWLEGLAVIQREMENALGPGPGIITRTLLRHAAATLRRCTPELAALGPPAGRLRPVYREARRACADFERAAGFAAAAARAFTTAGPDPKLTKLLDKTDNAVNNGTYLIDNAITSDPGAPPGT